MSKPIYLALGFAFFICMLSACNRKVTTGVDSTPSAPRSEQPTVSDKQDLPVRPSSREEAVRPSPNVRAAVDELKPRPVIEFKRTPCFGKCPVYELVVISNREMRYTGKRHVQLEGEYQAKLSPEAYQALVKKIEAANFYTLDASYPPEEGRISDLPNAITRIALNGREHTVTNNHDAPQALLELEGMLDALIKDTQWTRVDR